MNKLPIQSLNLCTQILSAQTTRRILSDPTYQKYLYQIKGVHTMNKYIITEEELDRILQFAPAKMGVAVEKYTEPENRISWLRKIWNRITNKYA